MSLQERTLVLKNFDPEKTTKELITELFLQAGPVKNVVIRPDHAFVEFDDVESVGYSKALLDGIEMFGKKLELQPKARLASQMKYVKLINDYIAYDRQCKQQQRAMQQQQQQQIAFYQQQQQQQIIPVTQQFSHQQPPIIPTTMPTMPIYPQQPQFTAGYPPNYVPQPQRQQQIAPNPATFNLGPFIHQHPSVARFMPPNPWAQQPPPSIQQPGPANSQIRRSWSFNDSKTNPSYSGNHMRNSDRRWR